MQDNYQNYLKSKSLKMPEPSQQLESSIKLDLDYSKRTKISKIKSLNALQKYHAVIIKNLKEQLAKEIPEIEKRKKIIKLNHFLRQAGSELLKLEFEQEEEPEIDRQRSNNLSIPGHTLPVTIRQLGDPVEIKRTVRLDVLDTKIKHKRYNLTD